MGHGYAKSALDVACWDAFGRIDGQPVPPCSAACFSRELPLYVAIPLGPAAEMARFARASAPPGSIASSSSSVPLPQDDAARVAAVVAATGPTDEITGDANGAWHRQDAILFANLVEDVPRSGSSNPARRSRSASRSAA